MLPKSSPLPSLTILHRLLSQQLFEVVFAGAPPVSRGRRLLELAVQAGGLVQLLLCHRAQRGLGLLGSRRVVVRLGGVFFLEEGEECV